MPSSSSQQLPPHFLVTPFNVRRPNGRQRGLDRSWLEHRFNLFELVCAPSVQAQTVKDFSWLLFVDWATPAEYIDRLAKAARQTDVEFEIVPIYSWKEVGEFLAAKTQGAILTSRLDNDDALSRTHIQATQTAIRQGAKSVQFVTGSVLYTSTGRVYRLLQRHSPFYSMISTSVVTAATLGQGRLRSVCPPTTELNMGFMRVIHDQNLLGTSGLVGRRVRPEKVLQNFAISPALLVHEPTLRYSRDAVRAYVGEQYGRARQLIWHFARGVRLIDR